MSQNGKGSSPRNCFSKQFKDNYEDINWSSKPTRVYLNKAKQIAFDAHRGQTRRNGKTPYYEHLQRVAEYVSTDIDAFNVAWLHDILEKTSETEESLREKGIESHIIDSVKAITKKSGETYLDYIRRVKTNILARKVKIFDIIDNLLDNPTERQKTKYSLAIPILLWENLNEK